MPQPRSRQLAMFPRPERLKPEMATPEQFHRLPGVMWHGNYDPQSLTRPPNRMDIRSENQRIYAYHSGGVHAGTRRAAMDALDAHGPYKAEKDTTFVPYNADNPREMREATEAHGPHGYLHPVLPDQRQLRRGLAEDAGDDWTNEMMRANRKVARPIREKALDNAAYGRPADWGMSPDEVTFGVRYRNENEHPDSQSVLMPNNSRMQHSDYVRDALLNGRPVHPLTERLYNDGKLDAVEARKYMPMDTGISENYSHSDVKRSERTRRVSRAVRSRQFQPPANQPTLPGMEDVK